MDNESSNITYFDSSFLLNSITARRISTPRAYREKEIYIKAHKGWNGYARHCLMAAVRRPSPRSIPCLSSGRTLTTRGCASSRTGEGETARIPAETFVHPPIHPPPRFYYQTSGGGWPDSWRRDSGWRHHRFDVTTHSNCWWQSVTSPTFDPQRIFVANGARRFQCEMEWWSG